MAAPATLSCYRPGARISCLPIALKIIIILLSVCKEYSFLLHLVTLGSIFVLGQCFFVLFFKSAFPHIWGLSRQFYICKIIWKGTSRALLFWKGSRSFGDKIKEHGICCRAKEVDDQWWHRPEAAGEVQSVDIETCSGRWQRPCQGGCVSSAVGTQGKQPPHSLTSNKKPLHINAVQFSFPPSSFIFPS